MPGHDVVIFADGTGRLIRATIVAKQESAGYRGIPAGRGDFHRAGVPVRKWRHCANRR